MQHARHRRGLGQRVQADWARVGVRAKLASGLNRARWCHEALDGFLEQARVITDIPARKALYVDAQKIFQQGAPRVAIAYARVVEAIRKEVLNHQSSPFGRRIFCPVSLAGGGE